MVVYTDWSKKLNGKTFGVNRIASKRPPLVDKIKQKSTRELLIEFMNKQDKFNQSIMLRFDEQAKFNKQQLEFNKIIINRIDRIVKVNNLNE